MRCVSGRTSTRKWLHLVDEKMVVERAPIANILGLFLVP